MSARNGDKSRFHRERKRKIARRRQTHELLKKAALEREPGDGSAPKSRPVSA